MDTHSSPDVLKGAVDILDDAIEPLPKIEHRPLPEEPETTPKKRTLSQPDKRADDDEAGAEA
jgi:hypothetical protein